MNQKELIREIILFEQIVYANQLSTAEIPKTFEIIRLPLTADKAGI